MYKVMTEGKNLKGMQKNSVISSFVIKHLIRYKNKKIDLKVIGKEKSEFEATSNIRLKNKADEKDINIILCGIVSRLFVMQELLFDYANALKAARK